MNKLIIAALALITLGSCSSEKVRYIYYDSGNLAQVLEYNNDLLNGKSVRYYDNELAMVWEQIDFVDHLKEGKWLKWYKNGNIKCEDSYAQDVLNGISKTYWENGNLKMAMTYKDGKLHGKVTEYSESGNAVNITYYEDGMENDYAFSHLASL